MHTGRGRGTESEHSFATSPFQFRTPGAEATPSSSGRVSHPQPHSVGTVRTRPCASGGCEEAGTLALPEVLLFLTHVTTDDAAVRCSGPSGRQTDTLSDSHPFGRGSDKALRGPAFSRTRGQTNGRSPTQPDRSSQPGTPVGTKTQPDSRSSSRSDTRLEDRQADRDLAASLLVERSSGRQAAAEPAIQTLRLSVVSRTE